jgi:hypothetical protein
MILQSKIKTKTFKKILRKFLNPYLQVVVKTGLFVTAPGREILGNLNFPARQRREPKPIMTNRVQSKHDGRVHKHEQDGG